MTLQDPLLADRAVSRLTAAKARRSLRINCSPVSAPLFFARSRRPRRAGRSCSLHCCMPRHGNRCTQDTILCINLPSGCHFITHVTWKCRDSTAEVRMRRRCSCMAKSRAPTWPTQGQKSARLLPRGTSPSMAMVIRKTPARPAVTWY
jgi:hypothetical protein